MSESPLRVLVADDRPDVREALRLLLKGAGHKTEAVDTPQALLRAADAHEFDLILMDLNYARDTTSGAEGLELLGRLNEMGVDAPIVVMTAWGSIDVAVEAMRRGACDFVQKPWDNERLLATVEKQARLAADRRASERRRKNEVDIAREVQQKLFPHDTKPMATIDYAGRCLPARAVGGDYYDFLDLGEGALGLLLADVSGKGTAAALLMANLQGCFRSQIDAGARSPSVLLRAVNKLFYNSTPREQYATAFFGRYDDRNRTLSYVNCGHPPPMLLRASGEIERLEPCATVLGAFRSWDCQEESVGIAPGETLIVFSDGVTDSGVDTGEEFGEERVAVLVETSGGLTIPEAVDRIVEASLVFSPDSQADDITVVGVQGR